jgi:hypothetical protein
MVSVTVVVTRFSGSKVDVLGSQRPGTSTVCVTVVILVRYTVSGTVMVLARQDVVEFAVVEGLLVPVPVPLARE